MAEETEKTSIKQLFQGMVGKEAEVLQGIVKSTSPLKIQIVNDEKLVIGPNITYVPWHLTDFDTEVTVHWGRRTKAAEAATQLLPPTAMPSRGARPSGYTTRSRWERKSTFWLSTTGSSITCWIG